MLETYKILNNAYDYRATENFPELAAPTPTRGNTLKLAKNITRLNISEYSFSNRIVNIWNSLPDSIVTSPTTNTFKNRLDKFWSCQDLRYNNEPAISLI